MGIFSKIYFGVANTITTDQGKLITGFAYGIGASVVIIGALFKILHLPGAEEMLMLGMGAEAFLFALGSFEPPHKEYDWSLVYPILAMGHGHMPSGEELPPAQNSAPVQAAAAGNANVAAPVLNVGGFEKEDAEKLSKGIKKLSDTAAQLNDLTSASLATEKFITNLESASTSAESMTKAQDKGAVAINQATEGFTENYGKVITSFESSLNTVQENSTTALNKATEELLASYKSSAAALSTNIDSVNGSSKEIQGSLKGISSQLSQINSVYELQLNSINEQLEANKTQLSSANAINGHLSQTDASLKAAAGDMVAFSGETVKLKQQITDLNSVYGNMLNALNVEA